jgi:polysaccharide export outer membrane protein
MLRRSLFSAVTIFGGRKETGASGFRGREWHLGILFLPMALMSMTGLPVRGAQAPVAGASVAGPQVTSASLQVRDPTPYKVHRGDMLELTFPYVSEFNQSGTVEPDGSLALRDAPAIYVEGLTIQQLTEAVRAAYKSILRDPVITIAPKDIEKPYFVAAGYLAKPGKYVLGDEINITEAVAMAGGFTDQSQKSEVVLFRRVDSKVFKTYVYDIKKLLAKKELGEGPWLQPGDIVYVPQNRFSKVMRFVPTQNIGAYFNPVP